MASYTLDFSGDVSENHCSDDSAATTWAEAVLANAGYDVAELTYGDWESDGVNDDGEPTERMLIWADEASSVNDPGANAIASLSRFAE